MSKNSTPQIGLFSLLAVTLLLCLSTIVVQAKPVAGDPPCR